MRLRDVARIELGSQNYMQIGRYQGKPAAIVAVYQSPGSNALETGDALKSQMEEMAARFPADVSYAIALDTTLPVSEGITEIMHTLVEAMVLVITSTPTSAATLVLTYRGKMAGGRAEPEFPPRRSDFRRAAPLLRLSTVLASTLTSSTNYPAGAALHLAEVWWLGVMAVSPGCMQGGDGIARSRDSAQTRRKTLLLTTVLAGGVDLQTCTTLRRCGARVRRARCARAPRRRRLQLLHVSAGASLRWPVPRHPRASEGAGASPSCRHRAGTAAH